jgi:hypothetical protein
MATEVYPEFSIITNDGWVITLVADKPITLGDAIVKSIIVQPKEDYDKRVAEGIPAENAIYRIGAKRE